MAVGGCFFSGSADVDAGFGTALFALEPSVAAAGFLLVDVAVADEELADGLVDVFAAFAGALAVLLAVDFVAAFVGVVVWAFLVEVDLEDAALFTAVLFTAALFAAALTCVAFVCALFVVAVLLGAALPGATLLWATLPWAALLLTAAFDCVVLVDTELLVGVDLLGAALLGARLVDIAAFLAAPTGCFVCLTGFTALFLVATLWTCFDGELLAAGDFLAEPPVALEAEPPEPGETFLVAALAEGFATVLAAGTDLETVDFGRDARVALTRRSRRARKVAQRCSSSRAHHRSESTRRTKVGDHSSSRPRLIRNSAEGGFLPASPDSSEISGQRPSSHLEGPPTLVRHGGALSRGPATA
ncbi:MAG: hypothetical protein ACLP6E_15215 [Acidimicrobiales bacterium]